jgi:hypothetical protein
MVNGTSQIPISCEKIDDEDCVFFHGTSASEPFRLGHVMKVVGIDFEDDFYGVIAKVREDRHKGSVPLIDLELLEKDDRNLPYLEEYADWFASKRS